MNTAVKQFGSLLVVALACCAQAATAYRIERKFLSDDEITRLHARDRDWVGAVETRIVNPSTGCEQSRSVLVYSEPVKVKSDICSIDAQQFDAERSVTNQGQCAQLAATTQSSRHFAFRALGSLCNIADPEHMDSWVELLGDARPADLEIALMALSRIHVNTAAGPARDEIIDIPGSMKSRGYPDNLFDGARVLSLFGRPMQAPIDRQLLLTVRMKAGEHAALIVDLDATGRMVAVRLRDIVS